MIQSWRVLSCAAWKALAPLQAGCQGRLGVSSRGFSSSSTAVAVKPLRVHVLVGTTDNTGKLAGWNRMTDSDHAELARCARPDVDFTFGAIPRPDTRILVAGFPTHDQLVAAGPDLQALIIPFAGLPATTRQLLLEGGWDARGLRVHSIHHNAAMTAEMAVALGLAAAKQLLQADRLLRKGDWSARGIPADIDPVPLPQLSLADNTAVVLGYGQVGRRVARVMKALGMKVLATRRSAAPGGSVDDSGIIVHPAYEMNDLLTCAKLLYVCVPETDDSVGLLGKHELALLPEGAVLVNVGRGVVVDEDALFEALRCGRLLSAGVDCWYNYPTDASSRSNTPASKKYDFASIESLVMSPHRAGAVGMPYTEAYRMRHLAAACNAASEAGIDAIPNPVNLARGY